MSGALRSVALSPHAAPWLAAVGGAVWMRAAWVFRHHLRSEADRAVAAPVSEADRRLTRVRVPTAGLKPSPPFRSQLRMSERATLHRRPAALHRLLPGKCVASSSFT
jgi:hypothetical protein